MEGAFNRSGFARSLWRLMLPIALQNLLSAVVGTADALMLTGVSQDALSASSLAGQVTFVLTLFHLGITTGASVLASQYWGIGDRAAIARVQGMALRWSAAVSLAFFVGTLVIPEGLMGLFTRDGRLIALGAGYLRGVSIGYLMMGVSQVLMAVMKSVEQTKLSAGIATACLLCNIALNALAIYGLFPNDEFAALRGVALATSVSRGVEVALCAVAIRRGKGVKSRSSDLLRTDRRLRADFWRCALPVQANYLVWGGATAAIAAILGHIGAQAVAASSLVGTLRNLVIVGCTGLGTAGSILTGKLLGAGDFENARWVGWRIARGSLLLGAASGLVLLALSGPCLAIARLDSEAAALFRGMLAINAVSCVGKAYNSSLVGGVFCAGGDTHFGLVCDAAAMWGVVLPLGCLAAFVWRWPPVAVYAVLCMDELLKLPFVARRFRQYRWLRRLTGGEQAA